MIKFVTFNIRCDFEQDGKNCFKYRKEKIQRKIENEKPDVICFQEVLPHVAAWLKETLTDYNVLGCGRSSEFADEQEAIVYRKQRFDLISFETYWLSREPYTPGSRYEQQSSCPRTTSEALLYDLEEAVLYRIVNTHLDHEGSLARKLGLTQIMERLEQPKSFPEALTVLAGDFNAMPGAKELAAIEKLGTYKDAACGVGGTFHDYGTIRREEKIDYIYMKEPLRARKAVRWEECENGVYFSDHYPVSVEIYRE